jgi:HNH endonuclease
MSTRNHRLYELLERTPVDKRFCVHCGSRTDLTLDHIIPLSRGGTDAWANCQLLCTTCNNKKGDSLDKISAANGKLRTPLTAPLPPKPNASGRRPLHSYTLEELWEQYDDAHRERKLSRRRVRLDALSREIQRRLPAVPLECQIAKSSELNPDGHNKQRGEHLMTR